MGIENKTSSLIYCENYGQAGVIAIIGQQYGLPHSVSFGDSFRYPRQFDPDIESFIYVNDEIGDDVKTLFEEIKIIGRIENPLARESQTLVYFCKKPRRSFNAFWQEVTQ